MTYNETIYIKGTRASGLSVSASVPARVLEDGIVDEVVAEQRSYNSEMISAFVPVLEWPDRIPPQTGDEIRRDVNQTVYRIGRVTRLGDCFSITARSR